MKTEKKACYTSEIWAFLEAPDSRGWGGHKTRLCHQKIKKIKRVQRGKTRRGEGASPSRVWSEFAAIAKLSDQVEWVLLQRPTRLIWATKARRDGALKLQVASCKLLASLQAVADLFRPRMRACLPTCYHDCTAQNGA